MHSRAPITVQANWRELWYPVACAILITGLGILALVVTDEAPTMVFGAVLVLLGLGYLIFMLFPVTYCPSPQDGSLVLQRHSKPSFFLWGGSLPLIIIVGGVVAVFTGEIRHARHLIFGVIGLWMFVQAFQDWRSFEALVLTPAALCIHFRNQAPNAVSKTRISWQQIRDIQLVCFEGWRPVRPYFKIWLKDRPRPFGLPLIYFRGNGYHIAPLLRHYHQAALESLKSSPESFIIG